MVGKTLLRDYNLASIEEYFDMIIKSYENGQFDQMKYQIKKLKQEQKRKLIDYIFIQGLLEERLSDTSFLYITQACI